MISVGIGGNFERSAIRAKKSLPRPLGSPSEDVEVAKT